MRAHFYDHVLDVDGAPLAGATVHLYQQGTTTAITETIYIEDDSVGNTTTTNPLATDSSGKVEFFLNDEKRLDLYITRTGYTARRVTVDVLELTSTSAIVVKSAGTPVGTRPAINFVSGATVTDDSANNEIDVAISTVGAHNDLTGRDALNTHPASAIQVTPLVNGADDVQEALTGALFKSAIATASVATLQTTTSAAYTDLTTAGPAVTVTTGTRALVIVSCDSWQDNANQRTHMSYAVSGATTVVADDSRALIAHFASITGAESQASRMELHTGLTAGSNTFTAKYRVSTGTGTFRYRSITVIPL